MTARGQMYRPIDALLTDGQWHGQSHPAAHPSVRGPRTELGWMQADQLKVRCHRPSGPVMRSVERCNRVASQPFSRANATGDASCEKEMRV